MKGTYDLSRSCQYIQTTKPLSSADSPTDSIAMPEMAQNTTFCATLSHPRTRAFHKTATMKVGKLRISVWLIEIMEAFLVFVSSWQVLFVPQVSCQVRVLRFYLRYGIASSSPLLWGPYLQCPLVPIVRHLIGHIFSEVVALLARERKPTTCPCNMYTRCLRIKQLIIQLLYTILRGDQTTTNRIITTNHMVNLHISLVFNTKCSSQTWCFHRNDGVYFPKGKGTSAPFMVDVQPLMDFLCRNWAT